MKCQNKKLLQWVRWKKSKRTVKKKTITIAKYIQGSQKTGSANLIIEKDSKMGSRHFKRDRFFLLFVGSMLPFGLKLWIVYLKISLLILNTVQETNKIINIDLNPLSFSRDAFWTSHSKNSGKYGSGLSCRWTLFLAWAFGFKLHLIFERVEFKKPV